MSGSSVAVAKVKAAAAKARLMGTVGEVKHRLNPTTIGSNLAADVRERATTAATTSVAAVRRHPGLFAGLAAGTIALLARHRIAGLLRRSKESDATAPASNSLNKKPATRREEEDRA